jgi:hypothetical protein
MTPRPTLPDPLESLLERILASDAPRAVFLFDGQIVSCPSGGQLEARWLQRPEAVFVGTYDCEVSASMLLEDLRAAGVA